MTIAGAKIPKTNRISINSEKFYQKCHKSVFYTSTIYKRTTIVMTLTKFILTTIATIAISFSSQAITIKEFYTRCTEIPGCTNIKIPKLLLKLENRHLSELKVVHAEKTDSVTQSSVINMLNEIEINDSTMVVNDNENGHISRVLIVPEGKKMMTLLVVDINAKTDLSVVYIRFNKKILNEILDKYNK